MVFSPFWPGQFITDTSNWAGTAHKFHYADHLAKPIDRLEGKTCSRALEFSSTLIVF